MRKLFRAVLASMAVAAALTGCGGKKSEATADGGTKKEAAKAADAIEIKVATVGNEKHQSTIAATYFKEKIEELSGGQVKVTIYPNASLGSEREAAEGVKLGTLEMTIVTTDGTLPSWVSDVQLLSIPYLFENKQEAYYILDEVLEPEFEKLFEAQGFKHLGFAELGFRHFTNNVREVVKASDMEGLSIRVQEATVWFSLMDCLKARGTALPFNELYTALQQGTIDGAENPLPVILNGAYQEVAKNLVLDAHTYDMTCWIMGADFFNTLTAEQQQILMECGDEAGVFNSEQIEKADEEALLALKSAGVKVSGLTPEDFKEAGERFYEDPEIKAMWSEGLIDEIKAIINE